MAGKQLKCNDVMCLFPPFYSFKYINNLHVISNGACARKKIRWGHCCVNFVWTQVWSKWTWNVLKERFNTFPWKRDLSKDQFPLTSTVRLVSGKWTLALIETRAKQFFFHHPNLTKLTEIIQAGEPFSISKDNICGVVLAFWISQKCKWVQLNWVEKQRVSVMTAAFAANRKAYKYPKTC